MSDLDTPVDSEEMIWSWLRQGWRYRVAQGNKEIERRRPEYAGRTKHEMNSIIGKGFPDYFLITSDAVRWAKDQGIPVGPARGSAASSLVCYLLRITEIDPMQYPLMYFERFIAPDREDTPDIDLDFDDERRHEVRAYLVERYGADRVGNIGTFTKYKGKNSLDDVARVYQIPPFAIKQVKEMIIERSGGDSRQDSSLADTIEMFEGARAAFNSYPDLWKATRLEGNLRGMSTHAAGVVVTNSPIADTCALYTREVKGKPLTAVSVNKKDAEYLGLLKMDFLGLSTMGMLRYALDYAGMTLEELYRVPMTDKETLDAFRRNDVIGIFQYEGRATRLVNREVQPGNFLELSDINGLSRPGPLFSGTTAEYIRVKHGEVQPTRFHPIIDELTEATKGQIIYQEQVLKALAEFGGLSVKRVHEIRRIISLKLGEAQFNTSSEDFIRQAMSLHGVKRELAQAVWGRLVTSASYSFNIAHCISYAMLGFWCMFMKVHFPTAFYAAQLRKTEKDMWGKLIKDAERHNVKINGVKPGISLIEWRPLQEKQEVYAGWKQLVGVGAKTAEKIIAFDKQKRTEVGEGVRKADDLLEVSGIGPASVEKFREQIDSDDPFGLLKIKHSLDSVREAIRERDLFLRRPTHNSDEILDVAGGRPVVWVGMVRKAEYKDAIEDERARTGKELDEIRNEMEKPDLVTSCTLHCYDDGDEDVYVRITRFDFPKFKEALESIRLDQDVVYVIARKSRGGFGSSLYVKYIIVIDPDDD